MKQPPAGFAQPRRKAVPKKQVRLNLRRASQPVPPEDEIENRQRGNFWKWFGLVALFHLVALLVVMWIYRPITTPPPPVQFISLLPEGDTVKGTPGTQAAPKVGATTPAPAHHHHTPPTPPAPPQPITPPPPPPPVVATEPVPTPAKAVIHDENAPVIAPTQPPKPVKPKIKVDLHLADGPVPETEKPAPKPKHLKKKPALVADDSQDTTDRDATDSDSMGLSKEQIAAKLGNKLKATGVTNATRMGISGSTDGHANPFADFYASIHDQFMDKWQPPGMQDPNAAQPIIQIHVEKDGRVPPERVVLLRSSGNAVLDDSALTAARSLGYLLQPLPDGCPPDISLNLKLTQ